MPTPINSTKIQYNPFKYHQNYRNLTTRYHNNNNSSLSPRVQRQKSTFNSLLLKRKSKSNTNFINIKEKQKNITNNITKNNFYNNINLNNNNNRSNTNNNRLNTNKYSPKTQRFQKVQTLQIKQQKQTYQSQIQKKYQIYKLRKKTNSNQKNESIRIRTPSKKNSYYSTTSKQKQKYEIIKIYPECQHQPKPQIIQLQIQTASKTSLAQLYKQKKPSYFPQTTKTILQYTNNTKLKQNKIYTLKPYEQKQKQKQFFSSKTIQNNNNKDKQSNIVNHDKDMKIKYPNLQKYKLNVKDNSKDNININMKCMKKTQSSYYHYNEQKYKYQNNQHHQYYQYQHQQQPLYELQHSNYKKLQNPNSKKLQHPNFKKLQHPNFKKLQHPNYNKIQHPNSNSNHNKNNFSYPPSLSIKDFHILKQLGRGQNGKIYSAIHIPTGSIYALKHFQQQKLNIQYLIDQMKIQLFCQHQNILKAYGYIIEKVKIVKTSGYGNNNNDNIDYYYNIFLIMQKGQHNLFSLIKQSKHLTQSLTIQYTSQILSGLSYLHSHSVIHRDIKPQNIILINNTCKITDFGWSVIGFQQRQTFCGTLQYMSPQVALGAKYNKKIDLWSIGILIYQMLTGQVPYDTQNILNNPCEQFKKRIFKKLPEEFSKDGREFLQKLLQVNPKYRISLEEVMKHKWIVDNKIRKTLKKDKYNVNQEILRVLNQY